MQRPFKGIVNTFARPLMTVKGLTRPSNNFLKDFLGRPYKALKGLIKRLSGPFKRLSKALQLPFIGLGLRPLLASSPPCLPPVS